MATQAKRFVKRIWGGHDSDPLRYLIDEFAGKFKWFDLTIAPGLIGAGAEVTTNTALPAGFNAAVGDLVFMVVPSALEAGIYVRSFEVAVADQVRVIWRNETAAGVTPTSRDYRFLLVRQPKEPSVI